MDAEYAFYPAGTEHIRLMIRHKGDSTVYFGSDYTVCRFQHGRWETLPVVNAWNSLLVGIGPNNPSRTEVPDVYKRQPRHSPPSWSTPPT